MIHYNFDYDPEKAKSNFKKHKITFEEAATIFLDPNVISVYDEEHSEIEDRWLSIGTAHSGKIAVVSHTFHEVDKFNINIRIISSRKPTKKEISYYQEAL